MTSEEWALAVTAFFSGLAAGFFGALCTIMRPMQAAMDGRGLPELHGNVPSIRGQRLGKGVQLAWSLGMAVGPIVALVLLWDDPGSTSFVLTAIGLGIVIVGVLHRLQRVEDPDLQGDPGLGPRGVCRRTGRRDGGATSRSTGSNS